MRKFCPGFHRAGSHVLLGAVQVEQRILRVHAQQRLHAEIMSLELLKTPGTDAQTILSHWGSKLERQGTCDSGNCILGTSGSNWLDTTSSLRNICG